MSATAPSGLFRKETLEARRTTWLGRPTVSLGLPVALVTCASVLLGAATLALLMFGTYERRVDLSGVLLPRAGLVKISTPAAGWIQSIAVHENQRVAPGDLLYVVNVDTSTANGDTQQKILKDLAEQRGLLADEISRRALIRDAQGQELQRKVVNLRAQIAQAEQQISMKAGFTQKLGNDLTAFSTLLTKGLASQNEVEMRQQSWMRSEDELESLKSTHLRLQGELIEAEYQLATNDSHANNELNTLRGRMADIEQQIANTEARHSIEIRAPASGTITAITGHPGQVVATGASLLTIVPLNSSLQAELLAPSRAIGFVRTGKRVLLRYVAYPYQKFGQYRGTVTDVSHAALPQEEVRSLLPDLAENGRGDTYYRVTVQPDQPDVLAYGKPERLEASMRVQAYVLLDKRPIYQWILDPMYALTRSVWGH